MPDKTGRVLKMFQCFERNNGIQFFRCQVTQCISFNKGYFVDGYIALKRNEYFPHHYQLHKYV